MPVREDEEGEPVDHNAGLIFLKEKGKEEGTFLTAQQVKNLSAIW